MEASYAIASAVGAASSSVRVTVPSRTLVAIALPPLSVTINRFFCGT